MGGNECCCLASSRCDGKRVNGNILTNINTLENQRERLNAQEAKGQNTHAKITHIRVELLTTCQESILLHQ